MKSIRIFLIAGILATLTLFNFVAALRGYQTSMQQADAVFDEQLLNQSQLVANLDVAHLGPEFRLDNNLMFQVWDDDRLVAASFHAPAVPVTRQVAGFDFANFDEYRWRTFTRFDAQHGHWIMVGERTDLRFVLAENVVLESVTPVLLGIPIAGLLIWLIVSHGLKPLSHLSQNLREKRVHDLSPLRYRNTPRELDQVVQSINGLIHRLSEALEREKRFSSDAAHELRTPISALKVQLHNLEQEVAVRGEAFGELQSGVERMQHLVEQLLSLYRSSPEQFAANCRPLDFHALVQNVIARQHVLIEARRQSIELEADACIINGEAFALDTMIANLLSNAIKYTHEGGRILVRLISSEAGFYLAVDDNGPGIPEAERERIFERFYRRSSALPEAPGCGLGLAIVTHVARLHRGEVSVDDSLFERGASFRVDFHGVE